MNFRDKVYLFLKQNDLFGKSYDKVLKILENKNSRISKVKHKIVSALGELEKSGFIKIKDGVVLDGKITPELSNLYLGVFIRSDKNPKVATLLDGVETKLNVVGKNSQKVPNNATVKFKIIIENNQKVAVVTDVLEVKNTNIYGNVSRQGSILVLTPEDKRFSKPLNIILKGISADEVINKRVSFKMDRTQFIEANSNAYVIIDNKDQILGDITNPLSYISSALSERNISREFPDKVLEEIEATSRIIPQQEIDKRTDYRDKEFITIDPQNCKDMDDAIAIEEVLDENGYVKYYDIYVAIADVTYYVTKNSETDKEARVRGNSLYFLDSVIPMLPEKLSNELCSLNPHQDKLAVVTKIRVNRTGEIVAYDIKHEAVIKTKQRFSYEEITAIKDGDKATNEKYFQYKDTVKRLYTVNKLLTEHAQRKGRLTIPGFDPTVLLDKEKSRVLDFRNDNQVDSHGIIEYLMVLNNQVVANFLNTLEVNHISRKNPEPSVTAFKRTISMLEELGVHMDNNINNKSYQNVLKEIKNRDDKKLIALILIKSMGKAAYCVDAKTGHFALALMDYSHFTSPIRRYSDLEEHRIVKETIQKVYEVLKQNNISTDDKMLSQLLHEAKLLGGDKFLSITNKLELEMLTKNLNECEKNSVEIERISDDIGCALYMMSNVNKTYNAYVSRVDADGVRATLKIEDDPSHSDIIEVFIPIEKVPAQKLHPRDKVRNKKRAAREKEQNPNGLALGDEIMVLITEVDLLNKQVLATNNFILEHEKEAIKAELLNKVNRSQEN